MAITALLTLAEAKEYLNVKDSTQDAEITSWIDALTPLIEAEVGAIVPREETFVIPGNTGPHALPQRNILSLTSGVDLDGGGTVSLTGVRVSKYGILEREYGLPLSPSGRPWTLTAQVGMSGDEVPANIRHAAGEVLAAAWQLRRKQTADQPPTFVLSYRAMAWLQPNAGWEGFA